MTALINCGRRRRSCTRFHASRRPVASDNADDMEVSIYRVRHRDLLTLCVLALLCLGIVMVQSASTALTGDVKWAWS